MPAITKGKVLVTGANGYIAVWVVKHLLEHGFSVRGTVRRDSSIPYLKETFKAYGDKLEFVVVPDITKDGAFDEAVKGVDAIEHTASPFHMRAKHPQEMIVPAVEGTLSVLRSALAHANDTVKRVVVTASCASVITAQPTPRTFSEADWNELSPRMCEERGADASNTDMYRASKTLAERAAWRFAEENKDKLRFDVAVLNPPFVWGPFIHEVDKPENLNQSMLDWYDTVVKGTRPEEQLTSVSSCFVDVRDLGLAHTLALEKEEAGGERIIVSSGQWNWQDWINAARKVEPSFPPGKTSYNQKEAVYLVNYDTSKCARILGLQLRGLDEVAADMVKQFKERGWVQ
ncbi:aldehyde reductase [Phanerochaete sordida]|uniref:Aldehyde reductase n=1 Tax=Phanerochaete sordida TaxID=48140 RepID=A0A9P3G1U2_9APHY|nr:aldehyde reductase [Phanerochaete sordida]